MSGKKEPRVVEITWANGVDAFDYIGNGDDEAILPTPEEAQAIWFGDHGAKQKMAKRTYNKWRKTLYD